MNPRTVFYKHPYATIVTAVFLFALLITALYFSGLYPGVRKTRPKFDGFFVITAVLLAATVASWIAAILLRSDDI